MQIIRVRISTGDIINKNVVVINSYYDSEGREFGSAVDAFDNKYTVVDRDYYGPIYEKK